MKAIVLTFLLAVTVSAANQNLLQFAPNYLSGDVTTPTLAGTIYSSQPGIQVTLSIQSAYWVFGDPSSGCGSQSTLTVTAPATIYVCDEVPDAERALTMSATASGFPNAELYLPFPNNTTDPNNTLAFSVTASPSIVDLSQGTEQVNVSLFGGASVSSVGTSYFSQNDPQWLMLGTDCAGGSTCTLSVNPSGLAVGQQYAALVTFSTSGASSPPLQNFNSVVSDTTILVTYTYSGTNLAITSGLLFPYDAFQAYSGRLQATGGTPPYTWSATGLPPGIVLSPTGAYSGTIGSLNTWTPQITVQDAAGNSLSEYVTVTPRTVSFTPTTVSCDVSLPPNAPQPQACGFQGEEEAFLVGYLSSLPAGIPVTLTPLFSNVTFALSGSGYCSGSPGPVTVATDTPVYVCILSALPVGRINFSFVITAPGMAPRVFAMCMDSVGTGPSLIAIPTLADVSTQTITISATPGLSGDYVEDVSVSYPPGWTGGDWVTTNFASVQSDCQSSPGTCNINVSANFGALPAPSAGVPDSAAIMLTTAQGAAASVPITYLYSPAQTPLRFIPITPCRAVDTRVGDPFSGVALAAGSSRDFLLPNNTLHCSIPTTAAAYSLNVTVVPSGRLSYLTVWPTGQAQPTASTLNSLDGRVKANAAIIPAGTGGGISVFASNDPGLTVPLVLDIDGYFVPENNSSALEFYTVTPCRVMDTRNSGGPIAGHTSRDFQVSGACGVPNNAAAYSLNVTSVPKNNQPVVYLTAWPTGQTQPTASVLNAPTGAVTANAAIIPAGSSGQVSVYASNDSDVVIDIDGYFATAGAGGLSLYNLSPCRVLDTRNPSGSPPIGARQTLSVPVAGSTTCSVPSGASAYVFNATVVPPGPLSYLTLWPDGQSQPTVSTLNAVDGAITSNLAIVPTTNGSIDAYVSNASHLLLDIFGYFAP